MNNNEKIMEVNIKLSPTEENIPDTDDCYENPYESSVAEAADKVARFFTLIAKYNMTLDDAKRIISTLENLECIGDSVVALEMLYAMFCASNLKTVATVVNGVIELNRVAPTTADLFMEYFFDDEEIDWFLVENWLSQEN